MTALTTMRSIAERRWRDLREAVTTIPDGRTWRMCAFVSCLFLVCAVPIGLLGGLLRLSVPQLSPAELIGTSLLLLVHPAMTEEIVFRGLLLPRHADSMSHGRLFVVAGAALVAYVASHPLSALLYRREALSLFENPVYLVLVALLGLSCTATYLISRSLWPSVALHWLTAMVWILFFGGHALLNQTARPFARAFVASVRCHSIC
jgi:predicted Abi (CAAX) family protease